MKQRFFLAVFLIGAVIGMRLGPLRDTLSAADVLPPVLAVGIALPAGWMGYDALRRR